MQRRESCGCCFFLYLISGDPCNGEGYSFGLEHFFGWKETERGWQADPLVCCGLFGRLGIGLLLRLLGMMFYLCRN